MDNVWSISTQDLHRYFRQWSASGLMPMLKFLELMSVNDKVNRRVKQVSHTRWPCVPISVLDVMHIMARRNVDGRMFKAKRLRTAGVADETHNDKWMPWILSSTHTDPATTRLLRR